VVADHQDETRAARLVAELQRTFADAILAGAPRAAETVIGEAIEAGLDEATIDDRVIAPALVPSATCGPTGASRSPTSTSRPRSRCA
jgi:hypothetical protein